MVPDTPPPLGRGVEGVDPPGEKTLAQIAGIFRRASKSAQNCTFRFFPSKLTKQTINTKNFWHKAPRRIFLVPGGSQTPSPAHRGPTTPLPSPCKKKERSLNTLPPGGVFWVKKNLL